MKQYADAIDAYRLIRRGLLADSNPRDVELMVGTDRGETTVYGNIVRTICERAKIPERKLHEYTPEEWNQIAAFVAETIDPMSDKFRSYPPGWRESRAKFPASKPPPAPEVIHGG